MQEIYHSRTHEPIESKLPNVMDLNKMMQYNCGDQNLLKNRDVIEKPYEEEIKIVMKPLFFLFV